MFNLDFGEPPPPEAISGAANYGGPSEIKDKMTFG